MYRDFTTEMRRAFEQTRAGNPMEATRIIRAALSGRRDDETPAEGNDSGTGPGLGGTAGRVEAEGRGASSRPRSGGMGTDGGSGADVEDAEVVETVPGRAPGDIPVRETLGRVIAGLAMRPPGLGKMMKDFRRPAPLDVADGARFDSRDFSCTAGSRAYRLYVPAGLEGPAKGLVLMLHGCTQDPEDFARGTRMNAQADAHGLVLAYPEQPRSQNASGCWNWFRPGDQARDAGEPAILAGMARALAGEFGVPAGRIFAAGLSAGGAMAAILAREYPDLFAAIGVHSGVPAGAAHDVVSAFAAMRGDAPARPDPAPGPRIVFHGTADRTVHPNNALALAGRVRGETQRHVSSGGRRYERTIAAGPDGAPLEIWLIDGGGHEWAGGGETGSYTDPAGPDASAEMVRFFIATATRH